MIIKVVKIINPTSLRQHARDYRLPITATVIFVAIVAFMVIGRLQARSVLGQILAINSSDSRGYANLLSKDKSDSFTRNEVGEPGSAGTGENKPSTVNSPASTPITNTSADGSTSGEGGSGSGGDAGTVTSGPGPAPAAVFSASVNDFRQEKAPELQCSSGSPTNPGNLLKCSKIYSFVASVQSVNGPGTVSYGWAYSVNGSNNGSYSAGSGSSINTLRNQITLSCKNPSNFTAQFVVTSPNSSKSQVMQISHNCSL